jgi:uncharacterized protein
MPWPLRMITYTTILLVIILIYFGIRYFRSVDRLDLRLKRFFKMIFWIMSALILAYPALGHLHYWLHGTFSRTGFPDAFIYLFWYGVICMGVMLNWLLLHDFLRPVVVFFAKKKSRNIKRVFAKGFLIIALLSVIYTAGKMIWDTHRITIEEITYSLPDAVQLPQTITIVHIADLHADKYTQEKKMQRYIKKVNDAKPDIVIFAGDLITSGTDHIEAGAKALSGIDATYGTYFVMGDHDYWVGTDLISEALEAMGIHVLEDENAWVQIGESLVKITGVTELYSNRISNNVLNELLNEERGESLKILAGHQASERLIDKSLESGYHMLLAGHTHGGQVRIPILFQPVTAARTETLYVNGNWMFNGMLLNINNGLGFTLAPVRYNAPAQVTVVYVEGI